MSEQTRQPVDTLVAHLFRHQAGQIAARLTRRFGPHRIDLIEDVIQETLARALRLWPYRGVPDNPAGWLAQAANNLMLDTIRREASFETKKGGIAEHAHTDYESSDAGDTRFQQELSDDLLAMMFAACHPSLSTESAISFTLKVLCGFSVSEIGRAFLVDESTIAQRIVRVKRHFRSGRAALEIPGASDLNERLETVVQVLYLLFNEGYNCHSGESLIREDLCHEAIRLTRHLADHPRTRRPSVHALLALMLFQASRLPARADDRGNLLLLEAQDRTLWDRVLIGEGFRQLGLAAVGNELTQYHIEAGIASLHASAVTFAATDWSAMKLLYDDLVTMAPSPVVLLNRSVVIAMIDGPQAGLAAIESLADERVFRDFHLFYAVRAEFERRGGDWQSALRDFERASELAGNEAERRFLLARAEECRYKVI